MKNLKSNHVFNILKGKVDPSVMQVIIALCEQQQVLKHENMVLAKAVNGMLDSMQGITTIMEGQENVVRRLERMRRGDEHDEEIGASTSFDTTE